MKFLNIKPLLFGKFRLSAGKHERFPYPYNVISINPNLTQNTGW